MKIDILFFNKKFENKDKFIVDSEIFSEYITTHGFEGKPKDLLLMPPSCPQEEMKQSLPLLRILKVHFF